MTGLYIHIPFCRHKCRYCDFVSFEGCESYVEGYLASLRREAELYRNEKIDTIFIGGGTPSYLCATHLNNLAGMCFDMFDVAEKYEFTIEVNPGTLSDEKITAMLEGGVNRVSVGVQSFNDDELKAVGRIHSAELAYNTICHLKKMGFSNISIDLMTALPQQTKETLKSTLNIAVSLPVNHISAYSLIIEENTPLGLEYAQGKLRLPDEDEDREMYEYTVEFLDRHGFAQYEISNFARGGFECRHNIKYWTGERYIGIGVAAHSYTGSERLYNTSDLKKYLAGDMGKETVYLKEKDQISEFIITGLRMNAGISAAEFCDRFGRDIKEIYPKEIEKFIRYGLLRYEKGRYFLTLKGINLSNAVLCEFV
ncbi:MAG: radical SAM family heme chaperone HemW [Clostridia bacterium]|nr:radical SAM family heme chaperone HemW [Clostridia bacterium]